MSLDRVITNMLGLSDAGNCCGEIAIVKPGGFTVYKPCRKRPIKQLEDGHWWCGDCMLSPRRKKINPNQEQ